MTLHTTAPGNRIRALRKRAGITQSQLGDMIGHHQTMIGNYETGKRPLTLQVAREIADALGVPLADLLADEDVPCRPSEAERILLDRYRAAPPAQRLLIERIAAPLRDDDDSPSSLLVG